MSVISLTKNSFNTEVMNSTKPVLIDFFATWCGPCRMLSPIIDEISEENADIKVCKVNGDEEPELAQAFGVASIPTVAVMKSGKLVTKSVGFRPKDDLLAMVKDAKKKKKYIYLTAPYLFGAVFLLRGWI